MVEPGAAMLGPTSFTNPFEPAVWLIVDRAVRLKNGFLEDILFPRAPLRV